MVTVAWQQELLELGVCFGWYCTSTSTAKNAPGTNYADLPVQGIGIIHLS